MLLKPQKTVTAGFLADQGAAQSAKAIAHSAFQLRRTEALLPLFSTLEASTADISFAPKDFITKL